MLRHVVVLLFVAGCADPVARIDKLTGDPVAGAAVFDAECATCHGAAGAGGSGPALAGLGLDTTEVISATIDGVEEMPSFEDTLSDQEIADVSAYVADL